MSIDLLKLIPSFANVVVIEFCLLHHMEAMTSVETVGITASKSAYANNAPVFVCTGEYRLEHDRADALVLMGRTNVQVIEEQNFTLGPHHEEADPLAIQDNSAGVLRREAVEETTPRSNRVKPSYAFQTLTHCFHAQERKLLCVRSIHRTEHKGRRSQCLRSNEAVQKPRFGSAAELAMSAW